MPALDIGAAAADGGAKAVVVVVLVVEIVLEGAATGSTLKLEVGGGALVTRGVGTRGGAVAPVVMTLSDCAITATS